ncbi:MAG: molybdopterin biosynthesis protein [Treponema sp.]|nr:molybdopterin biosynthesis protein [Treponema sp.]
MARRTLYLSNVPVEEALSRFKDALWGDAGDGHEHRREKIPSIEALDRVTAGAVYARCCSPLFNAAAMDGIAVVAAATAGASETKPVRLVPGRDFKPANTGDPVHPPYDAVIMAEDLQENGDLSVVIREAAVAWQHIRPIGEDIVTGEMIIPGSHRIRPIDIGVLLSAGIPELEVLGRPRVAIFPTGNEIVEPGQIPGEGEIIESNSRMFEALVREAGGEATRFAAVPDDPGLLEDAVKAALERHDMVLVNAGSSAGTEDHTAGVLEKLGRVVVHGVAMKPGKPVILAVAGGKPVIGIPGYPVSAYLAFRNFASPVLAALSGRRSHGTQTPTVTAVAAKRLVSSLKHREYVRVKLGSVDGRLVASPLARGAGAAMSLVRADGFCVIPQNSEGVEAGDTVRVELSRPLHELERTLVSIGSHDLILDIIADMMSAGGYFLAGTHVGSTAGLLALKRGECHVAPIHLLDEDSGAYNVPYLKRLFPGAPVSLVKGVGRVQGLIVKKGNPLGLGSLEQLGGCRYVNRQRGSGTRLFLDFKLRQAGVAQDRLNGYDREALTHMAVAAAVESGSADAGMGIASAAVALGLDFVPLGTEEYDFALHPRSLELPQFKLFVETLRSAAFRRRLGELGGYTCESCGEILESAGDPRPRSRYVDLGISLA